MTVFASHSRFRPSFGTQLLVNCLRLTLCGRNICPSETEHLFHFNWLILARSRWRPSLFGFRSLQHLLDHDVLLISYDLRYFRLHQLGRLLGLFLIFYRNLAHTTVVHNFVGKFLCSGLSILILLNHSCEIFIRIDSFFLKLQIFAGTVTDILLLYSFLGVHIYSSHLEIFALSISWSTLLVLLQHWLWCLHPKTSFGQLLWHLKSLGWLISYLLGPLNVDRLLLQATCRRLVIIYACTFCVLESTGWFDLIHAAVLARITTFYYRAVWLILNLWDAGGRTYQRNSSWFNNFTVEGIHSRLRGEGWVSWPVSGRRFILFIIYASFIGFQLSLFANTRKFVTHLNFRFFESGIDLKLVLFHICIKLRIGDSDSSRSICLSFFVRLVRTRYFFDSLMLIILFFS